jgi:hypothetical protein
MSEVQEEVRELDRERNRLRERLRQKIRYWRNKAKSKSPCRLTVTSILQEKNAQIRSLQIQSFGMVEQNPSWGMDSDAFGCHLLQRVDRL